MSWEGGTGGAGGGRFRPPMTEEEQGEVLEQDKEMGDNETEPTTEKDEL